MKLLKSWLASLTRRFVHSPRMTEMLRARRRISVIEKMRAEIEAFVVKAELETGGNLPPDLQDTVRALWKQHAALENVRRILLARARELECQEIRVQAAELLVRTDLGVTK